MRNLAVVAGVGLLLVGTVSVAEAQGGYRPPDCELNTGHFLVSSGRTYISGVADESDPVKKERLLNDAHRVLLEALDRGQGDNPAVWYFLGRYYVLTKDAFGADSAFDRAEAGAPDCAEDIAYYRQVLWVPIINTAIDSLRAGAFQGAVKFLREANALYDGNNLGFYYLGRIFGNEGETDSALYYFKKVVEIGNTDTTRTEDYNTSVINIGLLYSMMEQWDSAAVWYERYRAEIDPNDPQALTRLAEAYQRGGDTTQAMVLYDSVIVKAADMGASDLFKTGEQLFIAEHYDMAAKAFELGLEKNKFFRPALYNLANAYLAMAQDSEGPVADSATAEMEAAARRLVEVDPLSVEALELLAAALQLQGRNDETLALLEQREEMTFDVSLDNQQRVDGGFVVQGRVVNRTDQEITTSPLTFEFLDGEGNVLDSQTYAAQTLAGSASESFVLRSANDDVVAVRYHEQEGAE